MDLSPAKHALGLLSMLHMLAFIATCHAAMVAMPPSGFVWSTVPGLGYASVAVHDALLSRRTVNDFAPELPADWESSLLRAVEAATYAPNHKRTEPVRRPLQSPNLRAS